MRLAWLGRLGWLRLFPRPLLRFPLVIAFLRWLQLLGREGSVVMLVTQVLLPSAVVGVGRGVVVGAIRLCWISFVVFA